MANRPTIMGTPPRDRGGTLSRGARRVSRSSKRGGNAVDAGVASGIAMGVLQTDKVSFGGVAPLIIYLAKKKEIHCIDGLGVWPKAITPDFFQKFHGGKIPPDELRSVVPAAPDSWITALERFGTMSFRRSRVGGDTLRERRVPDVSADGGIHHATTRLHTSAIRPATKYFCRRASRQCPASCSCRPISAARCNIMADVEKANKRKGRAAALQRRARCVLQGRHRRAIVTRSSRRKAGSCAWRISPTSRSTSSRR